MMKIKHKTKQNKKKKKLTRKKIQRIQTRDTQNKMMEKEQKNNFF